MGDRYKNGDELGSSRSDLLAVKHETTVHYQVFIVQVPAEPVCYSSTTLYNVVGTCSFYVMRTVSTSILVYGVCSMYVIYTEYNCTDTETQYWTYTVRIPVRRYGILYSEYTLYSESLCICNSRGTGWGIGKTTHSRTHPTTDDR